MYICPNCETTHPTPPKHFCLSCGAWPEIDKMEKKYKLIKEYPGSPKIGSIITDINPNNGAKDSWFDINWCKPNYASFKLSLDLHPEKYPEFWELVEPTITTEDGYVIKCSGIETVYAVYKPKFEIMCIPVNQIELLNRTGDYIFFKLTQLMDSWIEHNKPKYSSKQIGDLKTKFRIKGFAYHLNIINEWETQNQ